MPNCSVSPTAAIARIEAVTRPNPIEFRKMLHQRRPTADGSQSRPLVIAPSPPRRARPGAIACRSRSSEVVRSTQPGATIRRLPVRLRQRVADLRAATSARAGDEQSGPGCRPAIRQRDVCSQGLRQGGRRLAILPTDDVDGIPVGQARAAARGHGGGASGATSAHAARRAHAGRTARPAVHRSPPACPGWRAGRRSRSHRPRPSRQARAERDHVVGEPRLRTRAGWTVGRRGRRHRGCRRPAWRPC